jgi:hypothetical protein
MKELSFERMENIKGSMSCGLSVALLGAAVVGGFLSIGTGPVGWVAFDLALFGIAGAGQSVGENC